MLPFLHRYADLALKDIFADTTPVSIEDPELDWLRLPPADFIDYCGTAKVEIFDPPVDDPATFRPGATFFTAQAHRMWVTIRLLDQLIDHGPDVTVVDIGGYPFSIDRAIREYLHRACKIVATVNQRLDADERRVLEKHAIKTVPVNLDPRVETKPLLDGMTAYLPLPDQSVDVVVFTHVIEHLYQPIATLRECFRVLRPGGKLLLSTDHGMLLGGLLNYLNRGEFVYEPVEGTAAMVFHEWRGHVRFYTEGDLRRMIGAAGGKVSEVHLEEVLYNSLPAEHFVQPNVTMPRWRARILQSNPEFRNEILIVAEPSGDSMPYDVENPFDVEGNSRELRQLTDSFREGSFLKAATAMDFAMGARLFWGRWPSRTEMREFQKNRRPQSVDLLTDRLLASEEFVSRGIAVQYDRPGEGCIVMTETADGRRYFFSAQDTFVGFPVAVGVFETAVVEAMRGVIRAGMRCVDAGASIGVYTVLMARLAGDAGGHVWAVEPDPFNLKMFERNLTENRIEDRVTLFRGAVGEKAGEGWAFRARHRNNFGGTRVLPFPDSSDLELRVAKVDVRPIDDWIASEERIDVVKFDVNGMEAEAMRGMAALVERCRPVIFTDFKFDSENWLNGQRILAQLEDWAYTPIQVDHFVEGKRRPFVKADAPWQHVNLVCFPAGHEELNEADEKAEGRMYNEEGSSAESHPSSVGRAADS